MMKNEDLVKNLRAGDPLALARAITWVENGRPAGRALQRELYPFARRALRVGITGAPGSGKSTLIERLIARLRKLGKTVAVLAVDPSSPLSGGALLGDRIRMIQHSNDPGVFIRSLASRGHLGGLSRTTREVADLMEISGRDVVIIETVGVGQSEIEVVGVADLVAMVLTPTTGDEIQAFKAGIVEIADLFVINKADLGGADQKISEIRNVFSMSDKTPDIIAISARENEGIEELTELMLTFPERHPARLAAKSETMARDLVMRLVAEKVDAAIARHPERFGMSAPIQHENPFLLADTVFARLTQGGSE